MSQRKFIHVAYLEGLASVGLLKSFRVEDCKYPGFKRVVAEASDGTVYETKCIDERGARRVIMYLRYAMNLAPAIVEGEALGGEEV